jgi:hypothetical protein
MPDRLPRAYVDCLIRGPFPDHEDPWGEAKRYFHQIHKGIIGALKAVNKWRAELIVLCNKG